MRRATYPIAFVIVIAATTVGVIAQEKDDDRTPRTKPILVLKYGDGKPDGRKSVAGTGEMIEFTLPDATQKLRGLRIHCARYGEAKAPDEEVEITFVTHDEKDVIHSELVPYSRFKRGAARWTAVKFEEPVETPEKFWVILDFNAQRTKGVYVSFDTKTKGKYSKLGVPGGHSEKVDFEGDWMVQAVLTRPGE